MPAHIRKGLITGRPAFTSGGLGSSIGSAVDGMRRSIVARAPAGNKSIGGGLSFAVNDILNIYEGINFYIYSNASIFFEPTPSVYFTINNYGIPTNKYDILARKTAVATSLLIKEFSQNNDDVSIFFIPLSNFITNVTSSSFEINIPNIRESVINDLSNNDYSEGELHFIKSDNGDLVKINEYNTVNGQWPINFGLIFSVASNLPVENVKQCLLNYTGKTYKFVLYSNQRGAVIVDGVSYPFNKQQLSLVQQVNLPD